MREINIDHMYYIGEGETKNTVEFKLVPIELQPIRLIVDGENILVMKPIDIQLYRLDHLQCRHLGNSWSQGNHFFTCIEEAEKYIDKEVETTNMFKLEQ